ncbi:MAG: hypothetical protein HUJ51_01445 [Eggerthellaceae bacterium]|nr:hypothetical protein [Eggerthellaceae bacterium]
MDTICTGGYMGFMFRFFEVADHEKRQIKLYYQSKDGKEGYQGMLTYSIEGKS